jgi:mutator protein MutT
MTNITQIVTSAVIYNNEKKALIVKRAADDSFPNMWEFPGGKSDFGESPEESVKREILEETGLKITPLQPVVVNSYNGKRNPMVVYVEIFYVAELNPTDQNVTLSSEHSEFAWIDFKDIANYETTEYIHHVIEKIQKLKLHVVSM